MMSGARKKISSKLSNAINLTYEISHIEWEKVKKIVKSKDLEIEELKRQNDFLQMELDKSIDRNKFLEENLLSTQLQLSKTEEALYIEKSSMDSVLSKLKSSLNKLDEYKLVGRRTISSLDITT